MSKKSNLFKIFQKDRKVDLTAFDLSFQNLLTCNFGGLTPVGHSAILPADRAKIGTNILTKVEPMPAPAFTRIKQNAYAFFTPNQTVWKHWNDYVTNGTAYGDTYGNNSDIQSTDNLWRPPQIPFNYIQLITKIGNGWAIPVHCFNRYGSKSTFYDFFDKLFSKDTSSDLYAAWTYIKTWYDSLSNNFHGKNGVLFFQICLRLMKRTPYANMFTVFEDIPYFQYFYHSGSSVSESFYRECLEVGCDYITLNKLYNLTVFMTNYNSTINKVNKTTENLTTTETVQFAPYVISSIRVFNDSISDDVSLRHSPFILEKKTYCAPSTNNRPINYYVFRKNLYQDLTFTDFSVSVMSNNSDYSLYDSYVRKCGYFWSSSCLKSATTQTSTSSTLLPYMLQHVPFNPSSTLDVLGVLGYSSPEEFIADNDFLSLYLFKNSYNEIFLNPTLANSSIYEIGSYPYYFLTANSISDFSPFTMFNPVFNNSLLFSYRHMNYSDVILPLYFDSIVPQGDVYLVAYDPVTFIPFTKESYNLGYDAFSMFIYLCQNSTKLLDYMNVPLEGLVSRDFSFYAGEFCKSLLFFGYSKIWNDYFRNKTVSTAELDYRETNSVSLLTSEMISFMGNCKYHSVCSFPDWVDHLLSTDTSKLLNGWSIPFDCAPKNSLSSVTINTSSGNINILDYNHFHDYRIVTNSDMLSVLTGFQLQNSVLFKMVYSMSTFIGSVPEATLYGILSDKVYLPSYYNGLLHYKYQNFNKDYFSSALLDPAAGVNDENIGSTVSSLVTAQAKQSFWNSLAFNRSVSQFWQNKFGIKPSHDDYDKPLLLGSAHSDINIGEVVQLSQTDTTPQGQRSGLGSAHSKDGLCNHKFNEHGYVLVLISHTLELQYMQGLEKDFTPEESFLDLPFLDFVGLGNQSIYQRELNFTTRPTFYPSPFEDSTAPVGTQYVYNSYMPYAQKSKINNVYPSAPHLNATVHQGSSLPTNQSQTINTSLANGAGFKLSDIFGFIPRYSTFKFKFDQVHGEFRDQLSFWHSFRKFFTQPILCHEFVNWEFMSENDELGRMFFVTDDSTDKFKIDLFINFIAYRPLPYVCKPETSH